MQGMSRVQANLSLLVHGGGVEGLAGLILGGHGPKNCNLFFFFAWVLLRISPVALKLLMGLKMVLLDHLVVVAGLLKGKSTQSSSVWANIIA